MKGAVAVTRRYLQVIIACCLGVMALVACHSGDMEASKRSAEPAQEALYAENVLGRGGDYFGYAIAMSGDSALVGQPYDGTRGAPAGAAYIYEYRGGRWKETAKLMPDDAAGAAFGVAVALDGNVAAVGAPGANRGRGAVYIFERQGGVWRQAQRLTVSSALAQDDFAMAIALSGSTLLVGAPGDREAGEQAGAVYVFERRDGFWSVDEAQKYLAYTAEPGAQFGRSVALSGSTALVGAPAHGGIGAAHIFERRDGLWIETAQLQAREAQPGGHFGYAVALSDAIAVVGSPHQGRNGMVYLVERQDHGWPSIAANPLTPDDRAAVTSFGVAVAIAGRAVLVGAAASSDNPSAYGAAYLFTRRSGEAWQEHYRWPQVEAQRSPHFGHAVALAGSYLLIGAPAMSTGDSGYVYAYQHNLANAASDPVAVDQSSSPEPEPPAADAPGDLLEPGANRPPRITSTPITTAKMGHVTPEIVVTDPHLAHQTITLNGQPFTPGTAITEAGSYELIVEAADTAGNISRAVVRFAIEPPDSP